MNIVQLHKIKSVRHNSFNQLYHASQWSLKKEGLLRKSELNLLRKTEHLSSYWPCFMAWAIGLEYASLTVNTNSYQASVVK